MKINEDKENNEEKTIKTNQDYKHILGLYSKNAGQYYSKPSEVVAVLKKIFTATKLESDRSKK